MSLIQKRLKPFGLYSSVLFLIVSSFFSLLTPTPAVQALDCEDEAPFERSFLENNIGVYGNCEPSICVTAGDLTSPAPTSLTGETNAEMVWNYFIQRGLSPVAAAGAMGNIEQESNFDPWIGEGGNTSIDKNQMRVGFGLIQWTNTSPTSMRRAAVMKYLEDNGIRLDATDASQNEKALLLELNFLWDVEYGKMTWQEQVNAETTVDGDTSIASFNPVYRSQRATTQEGNGSTMVFHALVERSNDTPTGLQERIDGAEEYLNQFGASAVDCVGSIGSAANMSDSGLTLEQAKAFMMRYGQNVNGFSAKMSQSLWPMCNGGGSNCVTFSHFFNNTFTDLPSTPGMGNGKAIVPSLVARGAAGGRDPRLFATFSSGTSTASAQYNAFGHTGIILGVQDGMLIVGHASCGSSGIGTGNGTYGTGAGFVLTGAATDAKTFFWYTNIEYAYPTEVNEGAIMEFIEKGYL